MKTEDFKALSNLGRALWAEPEKAGKATVETLSAVSLQGLTDERAMERTALVLLQRALQTGVQATASAAFHPFYRLAADERWLLSCLHSGRWSYDRLARLTGKSREEIGRMAWHARLTLASGVISAYPAGPNAQRSSCPEYDPAQPWTQRMLDEELNSRERLFFQNHLMACDSCRAALARCRNFYYQVEKLLPASADGADSELMLGGVLAQSRAWSQRAELTWKKSFQIFLSRPDILLVLGLGGFLLARMLLK